MNITKLSFLLLETTLIVSVYSLNIFGIDNAFVLSDVSDISSKTSSGILRLPPSNDLVAIFLFPLPKIVLLCTFIVAY